MHIVFAVIYIHILTELFHVRKVFLKGKRVFLIDYIYHSRLSMTTRFFCDFLNN